MGADPKGWLAGPWDGGAPVALGYATRAIDEPHLHRETTEIFLVMSGSAVAVVDGAEVSIGAGDVLILGPGEAHTFIHATADYRAFVVHAGGDGRDKVSLPRHELGREEGGPSEPPSSGTVRGDR